jgi:peptidoglycan/xylan/chitin deacetylase (PgdA/CDA1 family)
MKSELLILAWVLLHVLSSSCVRGADRGVAGIKVYVVGSSSSYVVYGGDVEPPNLDVAFEICNHPEMYGYQLLGSATSTKEFYGSYTYFLVKREVGPVQIDAFEFLGTSSFFSQKGCGGPLDWWYFSGFFDPPCDQLPTIGYCPLNCQGRPDGRYSCLSGFTIVRAQTKQFMITFDDGPVPGNTENIVNALENVKIANGEPVKAGFFMVGCNDGCTDTGASRFWPDCLTLPAEGCGWLAPYEPPWFRTKGSVHDNPDIVRYVAAAGHVIGNHTQHHTWFWWWPFSSKSVNAEIGACNDELESALDKTPWKPSKIFRPPYFVYNAAVRGADPNFQIIMGAGDKRDKATDIGFGYFLSLPEVKEKARDLIREWKRDEPCVLVFHDISPITANNIAEIIRYLREDQGFTLVHFDPQRLHKEADSVVHHATNKIHQSETVPHTVSLDSTVSTTTFNVSWKGSDLDLVLYKPDGTKIDSNSALADPNIKYAERDTYEYYTVSDPNPGNWIMEVSGVNVPLEGEKYTIRVEADSNLALFAFADKPDYGLNEHINISAQLVNDENSVTGALVMARVQRPDGSVDDNLILYDDGTRGDEDPNDGFYANAYNETFLKGSYEITVSAIGELTGDQYERAYSVTVMVGSIIYGNVDFRAYAVFAEHWLAQNCIEPAWCDTADLDQSGEVDIFDLGIIAEYWLEGISP